jgi:large subunit ribosomal protein L2
MFLKKFKPITNGSRHRLYLSSCFLNSDKFIKLKAGFNKNSGKNISGKTTVNHKINYTNRSYMFIDLKRTFNKLGVYMFNIKDSNRSCLISLIKFSNGVYSYVLTPYGIINGFLYQTFVSPEIFSVKYKVGYNVILKNLPVRSVFFNVELNPGKGGQYTRSAGTYSTLLSSKIESEFVKVTLPSKKKIFLKNTCLVTLGRASNVFHKNTIIGKAGTNVRLGIKPTVRGVAMNPVDHPHGGRTKTNSPEVTPWGKVAKYNK